jgi:hypothetical protein
MKNRQGLAAISAVLLISAVVLAIVTTTTILAIGEAQGSSAEALGSADLYLVDGCAEDILQKIHDSSTTSVATISRPEGTCSITYNTGGPTNWDVTVKETGTAFGRSERIVLTRGATLTITSWVDN